MYLRVSHCIFLLVWGALLSAQSLHSGRIGIEQGLSQGMVFGVLESREGFVWVATKDGLNRYDGYRFEIFSPDPFDPFSIAHSEVHTLFEDGQGRLWCGYDGGLDVFVPATNRFFHLPMLGEKFLDGYDLSFAETPDGTMWMAGKGRLWKIEAFARALEEADAAHSAFPRFLLSEVELPRHVAGGGQGGPRIRAHAVLHTKAGALLAATNNGLYRIDVASGQFGARPEALPGVVLYIVGEDHSGRCWLRSEEGLWAWKGQGIPLKEAILPGSGRWRVDHTGHLWRLSGGALHKWAPSVLEAGGAPAQSLNLMSEAQSQAFYLTDFGPDRSGNVWVGTSGYGLLKVAPGEPKFRSYLPLTSHRMFVEAPGGGLVSVAYPRTLYAGKQFDRPQPNPWLAQLPPDKSPGPVLFDPQGNCWAMLEGGTLCRVDARTKAIRYYSGGGLGLFLTKEGKLLSISEAGLLEFDPATEQFKKYPFEKPLPFKYNSASWLNYFFEDRQGILWMNAHKGLLKATPTASGYRFEHFCNDPQDRSSLSNDLVLSVAEDPLEPGRYLWVGAKGGGLNCLDRQTGQFTHFTTKHGLPDNVVYGILDSPGHLWLSTNKGLCRMTLQRTSPGGQTDYRFNTFTAADGLQDNEFNQGSFLKLQDGTMFFGGVNGVTVFHPDSLRFNERRPVTTITRLWVNNQPLGLHLPKAPDAKRPWWYQADGVLRLELPHHQNLVSVEFAALEFTNPAQNQYRYQLRRHGSFSNGEEGLWVEMGSKNSVQFANLRPGRYTFQVLGSNNDGIWGEAPAVMELVIRPPWWAAWWAYLLYVLVAGAGLLVLYRYQLRQKLRHQETLRLRELDDFKNRFFTNITHEFRTPLTVILGMAGQLEKGLGEDLQPKAMLIRRNGQNLLRLINQILDLAKLESNTLKMNYVKGDVLSYLRYIAESLLSLAQAQGVVLQLESRETEIIMDYDPERLLQIVHNLLSNAIKFTPAGGRVILGISLEGRTREGIRTLSGFVFLRVSDTGMGIPPGDLPYIFDRFYQAGNLEKAKAGGAGIGLALTKELVQAMGGSIAVESELNKGTTFTLRLPLTANGDGVSRSRSAPAPTVGFPYTAPAAYLPATSADPGTLPTLLIVEDNPDVLAYLAACLAAHYSLDFASNGRAGIEKAIETVPDLILSDVMMPEKDGFEVCDFLKNDERTSHIPIVLLTAKADVESRIAGLRRGADAYLAKPFHEEELLVTLANLLQLRQKLLERYGLAAFAAAPSADAAPSGEADPESEFLQKIRAIVEQNLTDSEFDMPQLERMLGMSRSQIFRKMKALTGRSPSQFIRSIRLQHGRRLLQTTELTVSEIAYEVGFSSVKYFSDAFVEEFGERPTGVRG